MIHETYKRRNVQRKKKTSEEESKIILISQNKNQKISCGAQALEIQSLKKMYTNGELDI